MVLKIAIVTPFLGSFGGSHVHALSLTKNLSSFAYAEAFFLTGQKKPKFPFSEENIRFCYINPVLFRLSGIFCLSRRLDFFWKLVGEKVHWNFSSFFSRIVFEKKIDFLLDKFDAVVFLGYYLGPAVGFLSIRKKHKAKLVWVPLLHFDFWGYERLQNIFGQFDSLLAMTNFEKNVLVGLGVDKKKIVCTGDIADEINGEAKSAGFSLPIGKRVLFVGRKFKSKGIIELLESSRVVWQKYPKTFFLLAGPDGDADFSSFKDERVFDVGFVSEAEKRFLFESCDLLCVPSVSESFGLVYLEAWKYAKPVIAADIPTSREILGENRERGLLVEQNPKAISDAIIYLLDNPQIARRMGAAGKKYFEENFSPKLVAKKAFDAINSLF